MGAPAQRTGGAKGVRTGGATQQEGVGDANTQFASPTPFVHLLVLHGEGGADSRCRREGGRVLSLLPTSRHKEYTESRKSHVVSCDVCGGAGPVLRS